MFSHKSIPAHKHDFAFVHIYFEAGKFSIPASRSVLVSFNRIRC